MSQSISWAIYPPILWKWPYNLMLYIILVKTQLHIWGKNKIFDEEPGTTKVHTHPLAPLTKILFNFPFEVSVWFCPFHRKIFLVGHIKGDLFIQRILHDLCEMCDFFSFMRASSFWNLKVVPFFYYSGWGVLKWRKLGPKYQISLKK